MGKQVVHGRYKNKPITFKRGNIGRALWHTMEEPQGYAFLSDGIEALPADRVLAVARASLTEHLRCVKILRAFLRTKSTEVQPGIEDAIKIISEPPDGK